MARLETSSVRRRLTDLEQNAGYHARSVQAVIDSQVDPEAARRMNAGGGGKTVFDRALRLIRDNVRL